MRAWLFVGASFALTALSGAVAAQTDSTATPATSVSEIIVTAEKRSERLIDVPAAVSAIQASTLNSLGAHSVGDFAALVPGLQVSNGGAGSGSQLVLRGIAVNSIQSSALVGVVVDGVPVGSSSSYAQAGTESFDSSLWDVARVEVLRGPQGTLYGANAMGGLLSYVYNEPNLTRYGGAIEAEGSDTEHGSGSWAVRGMLNLPLAEDRAALRISAWHDDDGGFIDDPTLGRKDVNRNIASGARAELLLKPIDRLTVRLEGVYGHDHRDATDEASFDQPTGQPIVGPLIQTANILDPAVVDYREGSLSLDYDAGPVKLTSISSYQRMADDETINLSLGSIGFFLANPGLVGLPTPPASATAVVLNDSTRKFTEEFRVTSNGSGPFKYLAGFFYTHEATTNDQVVTGYDNSGVAIAAYNPALNVLLPSVFQEYAVFGQASYTLFSRLELTAGVRYSHDETSFSDTNTGILSVLVPNVPLTSGSSDKVNFLAAARYAVTNQSAIYVRAASGYRPGGPNVAVAGAPSTYAPDSLWNYEVGYKASFLDGRADINLDAFYITWRDIQALTSIDGFSAIVNGGSASSRGFEAEGAIRPGHGVTLGGSLAYTDAHLDQDSPLIGGLAGDPLPLSPRWSGALYGDWTFPIQADWKGFVGGTLRAVGQRDISFPGGVATGDPNFVLPSYVMGDLRAGVEKGRYRLTVYLDNVGDTRARISALTNESTIAQQAEVTIARPRTIGVRLDAGF